MAGKSDDPYKASFDSLCSWVQDANSCAPDNPPDFLAPLCMPSGTRPSIQSAAITKLGDRNVVGFRVRGQATATDRYVLPVHFAIMRALELVPGLLIRMVAKNPGRYPRDKGIYVIQLKVSGRTGLMLKHRNLQAITVVSIMRILFDAPSDAEIREIYKRDHHMIVPSNYVLTKQHVKDDNIGREAVLRTVRILVETSPGAITADAIVTLLTDLFKLSEKWHHSELCGHVA